jgi:MATE family multidrug resistance protein
VLVAPGYASWRLGWGLNAFWGFASAYIMLLAVVYVLRFLQGKWRTMRVIEHAPAVEEEPAEGEMAKA